jgi:hypothetical protein
MSEQQSTDSRIRAVEGFDPRRFITRVSGQDYLEVKWRLLWLRTYDPKAELSTELVSHQGSTAVFKAKIVLSEGGSSMGWGSETYDDFRDYLEKAETKAIGRALAALGFGTQFTPDFDFEQGTERVVDAPVRMAQQPRPQTVNERSGGPPQQQRPAQPGSGITDRQISFIRQMAKDKGISEQVMSAQLQDKYDEPDLTKLERRDASAYIEQLKEYRPQPQSPADEYEPSVNQVTGEIIETADDIPF